MKYHLKKHCLFAANIFCLTVLILMFSAPVGFTQEKQLKPGQYITEGGWGNLFVKQGKSGVLNFSIQSVGGNQHTCGLEGHIRNGRAVLKTEGKAKPCVVKFLSKGDDIDVIADGEECRNYCGAPASFEGLYLKPAQGCNQTEVRKIRNEFKHLYDKKAFAQALEKLEPVLKNCKKSLDWLNASRIQNDLAITRYRLHDLEGCRQMLLPLADDAAKTEEELRETYPPSDADSYMPILNAVRTNLKLCNPGIK